MLVSSSSLLKLHGMTTSSSRAKINQMMNYRVPLKPSQRDANANGTRGAITFSIEGVVDSFSNFADDFEKSALLSGSNFYDIGPTNSSLLAFYTAMALAKPLDRLQLFCSKNIETSKFQRESRMYSILQRIQLGSESELRKYQWVKNREDVELFEKQQLKCYFDNCYTSYCMRLGVLPSPTFTTVVIPPQRQKKVYIDGYLSLVPELTSKATNLSQKRQNSANSVNSNDSSQYDYNYLALCYEPREVLTRGAKKLGQFVIIGYDNENSMTEMERSVHADDKHSLHYNCDGWAHRNGILRYYYVYMLL